MKFIEQVFKGKRRHKNGLQPRCGFRGHNTDLFFTPGQPVQYLSAVVVKICQIRSTTRGMSP